MSRRVIPQKILLFKVGAIGDVLMTTPLIRAMRNTYPDAQIDYLTGQWSAPVLKRNPAISNIITFPDWVGVLGMMRSLFPVLIRSFLYYDTVVVLDKAWQLILIGRMLGKRCIGFNRNGEGVLLSASTPYDPDEETHAIHDIKQYLKVGNIVGVFSENVAMDLFPSDADMRYAKNLVSGLSGAIIAICPGGARNPYQTMDARRWPKENYANLARHLLADGKSVVVLGGAGDVREGQYIAQQVKHAQLRNLIGHTSLGQAAAILSVCSAVVVHDTSLLHVASAMKAPVVALFGPTNPNRKQPLNVGSSTLYHAGACPSCGRQVCHWEYLPVSSGCKIRMDAISVQQVTDAIDQIVATGVA